MERDTLSNVWCYCELSTFLPLIMVSAVRYSLSNRRSHTLGLLPGSPHTDVGLCRKLHQSTDMSICFLAFGLLVWDIALLIFKCWTSGQVKTKTHFFLKKDFCMCMFMCLHEFMWTKTCLVLSGLVLPLKSKGSRALPTADWSPAW